LEDSDIIEWLDQVSVETTLKKFDRVIAINLNLGENDPQTISAILQKIDTFEQVFQNNMRDLINGLFDFQDTLSERIENY